MTEIPRTPLEQSRRALTDTTTKYKHTTTDQPQRINTNEVDAPPPGTAGVACVYPMRCLVLSLKDGSKVCRGGWVVSGKSTILGFAPWNVKRLEATIWKSYKAMD